MVSIKFFDYIKFDVFNIYKNCNGLWWIKLLYVYLNVGRYI